MLTSLNPFFSTVPTGQMSRTPVRFSGDLDTATIANYFDNDGTVTDWVDYGKKANTEATDALVALFEEDSFLDQNTTTIVCTGKPLSGLQPIASFLRGVKIQALGTGDGLTLFINKTNLPASEWIASLKPSDKDPKWAAELRDKFGWDSDIVNQTLQNVLQQEGFLPYPEDRYFAERGALRVRKRGVSAGFPDSTRTVWVKPSEKYANRHYSQWKDIPPAEMLVASFIPPDGNAINFSKPRQTDGLCPPLSQAEEYYTASLMTKIDKLLTTRGMKFKPRHFPYRDNMIVVNFNPAVGSGKTLLLEFLLREYLPMVEGVIAGGDTPLDEFLKLHKVQVDSPKGEREIPVTSIQVGDNSDLRQMIRKSGHPDTYQVPSGGLAAILRKILPPYLAKLGLTRPEEFAT